MWKMVREKIVRLNYKYCTCLKALKILQSYLDINVGLYLYPMWIEIINCLEGINLNHNGYLSNILGISSNHDDYLY